MKTARSRTISPAAGVLLRRWPAKGGQGCALAAAVSISAPLTLAQSTLPPAALEQIQHVVGNRIEAVSILGGDYAAAGGVYTFRGGNLADLSISKLGGGGEVAPTRPLGLGSLQWAPVLQGNFGMVSAENRFQTGYLAGNQMNYDTLALEAGGGVAVYLTEHLSLTPTISGMYGNVIRLSVTARSNFAGIAAKPGANTAISTKMRNIWMIATRGRSAGERAAIRNT